MFRFGSRYSNKSVGKFGLPGVENGGLLDLGIDWVDGALFDTCHQHCQHLDPLENMLCCTRSKLWAMGMNSYLYNPACLALLLKR